jgi:hypothetical protein
MRGRTVLVVGLLQELEDGSELRALLVLERLPKPPRVPDVGAAIAAALVVRDAHERRGFRCAKASVPSSTTLRLVPPSRRAA